jgi:hypothetical protein
MDHFKKVWNVLGPRQTLFIKVPARSRATADGARISIF